MNTGLMNRVCEEILNPEVPFDMLGVSDCIAGIACRLGGEEIPATAAINVLERGRVLLGLSREDAHRLFWTKNWPPEWQTMDRRRAAVSQLQAMAEVEMELVEA